MAVESDKKTAPKGPFGGGKYKNTAKKTAPRRRGRFSLALKVLGAFPLNGDDAEDLVRDDHEDEVEDPDDVPAQEKAQDPGEDLPFHKARDEAAYPRSDGDDRQDHADEIVQAEIVFFGSHDSPSFFDTTIVLFGGGNVNLLTKKAEKIFCGRWRFCAGRGLPKAGGSGKIFCGRRGSPAAKSFDICARIKYNIIYLGIMK